MATAVFGKSVTRRKATDLEQRQPGCLEKGDPVFLFGKKLDLEIGVKQC